MNRTALKAATDAESAFIEAYDCFPDRKVVNISLIPDAFFSFTSMFLYLVRESIVFNKRVKPELVSADHLPNITSMLKTSMELDYHSYSEHKLNDHIPIVVAFKRLDRALCRLSLALRELDLREKEVKTTNDLALFCKQATIYLSLSLGDNK